MDLIIIGAGPAGLAAAHAARARGLSVRILEARTRVGGRVVTTLMGGHPVDLGAHWLHAGPINPVVALARSKGWRLKRAPVESHLFVDGRRHRPAQVAGYHAAFGRADRALAAMAGRPDIAADDDVAAARLPPLGQWARPVGAITGLVCGRPLAEVSARDFASSEYADNLFAPEGFGTLLARLGRDLPVALDAPVTAIDWSGQTVRLTTRRGVAEAVKVLVTAPPVVLQGGAIRFTPPLPEATQAALAAFRPALYEHVLLRWPNAPFQGADRIATLTGRRLPGLGLLTRLDGTALHYLEFDAPLSQACGPDRTAKAAHLARTILAGQFGARALRGLAVLAATDWQSDPLACGSWSSVPPGHAAIRDVLAMPVAERLAFAGEATDHAQWGTVGGAWMQGTQAVGRLFGPA
ncbi:MAG: FAD-dependent oxidoreductase [Hyphomicrobiales bacterium]|jgi:monoamine oxidase|nr:FAD-dependent oxidoreductase [Hyphomicrobiales bacterium]